MKEVREDINIHKLELGKKIGACNKALKVLTLIIIIDLIVLGVVLLW